MKLSPTDLAAYVLRTLGSPFWKIELSEDQVKDAISDALICYSRWKPCRVPTSYLGFEGIRRIDKDSVPKLPDNINGMVDWRFTTNIATNNPNVEAQLLSGAFAFYGVRSPLYDIHFYDLQRRWIELAGRELSSRPDLEFRLNEVTTLPELWLYSPGYGTNFEVIFSRQHSDLKTIPEYDEGKIKNLAVARAKQILGQIRSKYDKVPVANTTMVLNGPALVMEGNTAWEAEENKLKRTVADLAVEWV